MRLMSKELLSGEEKESAVPETNTDDRGDRAGYIGAGAQAKGEGVFHSGVGGGGGVLNVGKKDKRPAWALTHYKAEDKTGVGEDEFLFEDDEGLLDFAGELVDV